jgi:dTDP-4-dehydrorhamnose reductase
MSKLAGDEAVMAAGGAHLIARTSWVYAARGTNFLNTMIRLATEREELRVVADQVGAPTSARVIAETLDAIIAAAGASLDARLRATGGVLNVACSGETSWHGFATAIVEEMRARGRTLACRAIVPIGTRDYPTKAVRPANSRFDLSRLRERFGLSPLPWRAALARECAALAPA